MHTVGERDVEFEKRCEEFVGYLSGMKTREMVFDLEIVKRMEWFLLLLPQGHPIFQVNYDKTGMTWVTFTVPNFKKLLSLSKVFNQVDRIKYKGVSLWEFFNRDCIMEGSKPKLGHLNLIPTHTTEIIFPLYLFPNFIALLKGLMDYLQVHLHINL
eukprot:TRINITY_DN4075_c0_g1_i2.p1 TRINITY_DN4075_c0_g1~~TRINITY_DN4075_c0_g1_i2.p1  ORF type:complete len:156 (-),score=35.13 TRINITY_DN4075_c0_g1_i2:49-516(-)